MLHVCVCVVVVESVQMGSHGEKELSTSHLPQLETCLQRGPDYVHYMHGG